MKSRSRYARLMKSTCANEYMHVHIHVQGIITRSEGRFLLSVPQSHRTVYVSSTPIKVHWTFRKMPGCSSSSFEQSNFHTYVALLSSRAIGAYVCTAPARRYSPCVSLPAEAACTTRREPSSAVRAATSSNILKRTLVTPPSSAERPVLQKHGSRELMTIGFGSVVVVGSTVSHSFLMMYSCSSFDRLYLNGAILVRVVSEPSHTSGGNLTGSSYSRATHS